MAYQIDIFNIEGNKVKEKKLNESIFNDENINESIIHEFVLMQQSNSRNPIAHTKTRWEVKMSWRKLYKQKWTWRARVWDAWSPIRRKWWVCFWPRNVVNYQKSMLKKVRRKALFWTLTLKAKDNELLWLDNYPHTEIKTKLSFEMLKKLWLINEKLLVVVNSDNDILINSIKNISNVKYVIVNYLNPYDLLIHKKVLFLEDTLDKLVEIFIK